MYGNELRALERAVLIFLAARDARGLHDELAGLALDVLAALERRGVRT